MRFHDRKSNAQIKYRNQNSTLLIFRSVIWTLNTQKYRNWETTWREWKNPKLGESMYSNCIAQNFLRFITTILLENHNLKRAFRPKKFLLGFSRKIFWQNLRINFTKFELSTTFCFQDMTVQISTWKGFFPLEIWPGLPTTNKISKSCCMFVTSNKHFWQCCCRNKVKGQNFKLMLFK